MNANAVQASPLNTSHPPAGRMDSSNHGRKSRQEARPRRNAPNDSQHALLGLAPEPRSSPLPQTQWTDIPLPYRPHNWVPQHPTSRPPTDSSHGWRLRPSITGSNLSTSVIPEPLRTRRRPRELHRSNEQSDAEQPFDVSMLYPEMNPYHGEHTSGHGRSVSQPSSPNFMQLHHPASPDEPHPSQLPRSPTYPPAGRRRMNSASAVGDAAFADEEEFRLFVEATAGLGPETAFRHSASVISPGASRRQLSRDFDTRSYKGSETHRPYSEHNVSPIEETPTTMLAFQQLAQLPQGAVQPRRQRLESSPSGLDLWLPTPNRTASPAAVPQDAFEEEFVSDEELPDYAASQAQAQAGQRVEAARRARELQRRWQESGGRHGH